MTSPRPVPLAGEVARRPVLGSVLVPGRLLVPWRVLGQLLPAPWRLLMPLPALRQVLVAPGQVRQRGQERRVIAGQLVY
jgi:hypothetical protein